MVAARWRIVAARELHDGSTVVAWWQHSVMHGGSEGAHWLEHAHGVVKIRW